MADFTEWESFYVIVGSAAGALIGLQFVVMTLIAEKPPAKEAGAAFGTPTIVHFGAVLLLSALVRVPWIDITPVAVLWGVVGLTGAVYTCIVARRVRRQGTYRPVLEDWLFHAVLPFAAYAILALSALAVRSHGEEAVLAVGAMALLLLFTAIHNAWDAVAYHVFVSRNRKD